MTRSANFLDKEPADLQAFLVRVARQDSAPSDARERALRNAATVAAGVGLLSATSSAGSSSLKLSGWLAAKWLTGGLAAGLLSLGAAQGVAELASHSRSESAASRPPRAGQSAPKVRTRELGAFATAGGSQVDPSLLPQPVLPGTVADARSAQPAVGDVLPTHEPVAAPRPARATATAERTPEVASSPAATSPLPASSLSRELGLLESARRALEARTPEAANAALDHYAAEFPNGSLRVEAAALRVEAVGQAGNSARARALADAFLKAHPASPLAERVQAAAQSFQNEVRKP